MPTHPGSTAACRADTWSITPSVPLDLAEETDSPPPFDNPHFPTFHFLFVSSLFPTYHLCDLSFKGSSLRPWQVIPVRPRRAGPLPHPRVLTPPRFPAPQH